MKRGDKVRCLDASGWEADTLTVGKIYTIKSIHAANSLLELYEVAMQNFRINRFELVETAKDEYAFFAAVRTGHCACDTPIDRCKYHG